MKIELEVVNTFLWQLLKKLENRSTFSNISIIQKISKISSNLSVNWDNNMVLTMIFVIKFW